MSTLEPTQCHIDLIPVEILTEIFLHVCDAHTPSHQPKSLQEPIPLYIRPIDLSHVSRCWRDVALACARLWTCIVIADRHEHDLERFDVFVERSKQSPLHMFISWTPTEDDRLDLDAVDWMRFSQIRDVFVHETLEKLISSSHRWASFFLYVETAGVMSCVLKRLSIVEAPLLRDVTVCQTFYRGVDAWSNEEAMLANDERWVECFPFPACDLRTSYLDQTVPNSLDRTPYYPNLQSLTLDHVIGPSIPNFMRFLATFPLLEALTLQSFQSETIYGGFTPPPNGPLVELPLLRYFCISALHPQDGEALFSHLRIPNVKIMDLDCAKRDNLQWDTAISLLSAVYPDSSTSALDSVQVLRIGQLECDSSLLPSFFQRLANLRVLVIDCSSTGWDKFLVHVQTTPHLPLLTTLVCPGISYEQLYYLVVERTMSSFPIQHVFVTMDTRISRHAVVSNLRTVEVLEELPSSEDGQIDASLGDLVTAYLRVGE
ncbi:uncharacterized protein STEHIDRAFT_172928 [Stereum hirsutum FP-91666 SS1]|uniref:Uncharacterized protein n=1 Tax=Stereum hirsutum (strain FP-91666) TaxID=721885 RepID=R7S037_STEHR|nr:uncharacterized protein STEHIDRAFT_172928 [Stereum hirsutum FP-91666 SS1]EIM79937.1 hypothetical protein STEHIDRAFT_172928 [Stereum hirsutum FP-91666 SS1]